MIKGDNVFVNPSYPLYYGIGCDRFDERLRSAVARWFVRTISVNGDDVPKDFCGNVNLEIPTREDLELINESLTNKIAELSEKISQLEEKIKEDKDNLYDTEYNEDTKTLTIKPKQISNEDYEEELPSES